MDIALELKDLNLEVTQPLQNILLLLLLLLLVIVFA